MYKKISIALLSIGFLGFGVNTFAHTNGTSIEQQKDGYTIDVGYSSAAPAEGESLVMDFNLLKDGVDVTYSDVWVKIEAENNAVVFASGIHNSEFGGPRMSYVFPEAGKYTVSVRYENGAESIVEDSFPITVLPVQEGFAFRGTWLEKILYGGIGVLLGVVGTIVAIQNRRVWQSAVQKFFKKNA